MQQCMLSSNSVACRDVAWNTNYNRIRSCICSRTETHLAVAGGGSARGNLPKTLDFRYSLADSLVFNTRRITRRSTPHRVHYYRRRSMASHWSDKPWRAMPRLSSCALTRFGLPRFLNSRRTGTFIAGRIREARSYRVATSRAATLSLRSACIVTANPQINRTCYSRLRGL